MEIHPQTGQTAMPSHTNQAKILTGEIPQPRKEADKQVSTSVAAVLRCAVACSTPYPNKLSLHGAENSGPADAKPTGCLTICAPWTGVWAAVNIKWAANRDARKYGLHEEGGREAAHTQQGQ